MGISKAAMELGIFLIFAGSLAIILISGLIIEPIKMNYERLKWSKDRDQ
jgi:hypothetical protein